MARTLDLLEPVYGPPLSPGSNHLTHPNGQPPDLPPTLPISLPQLPTSPPPPPQAPHPHHSLHTLNNNPNLFSSFKNLFNIQAGDPDHINPIPDPLPNQTSLFDEDSFRNYFSNTQQPIIASINAQSLSSKHNNIQLLLQSMQASKTPLLVLAIQETWKIQYADLLSINGFKLIYRNRPAGMRGGGVGFYVWSDLEFRIVEQHTNIVPNIFECITIEIMLSGRKTMVSSIYRSPKPPATLTAGQQLEQFNHYLNELLHAISRSGITAYICLDSNINQLTTDSNNTNFEYFRNINDNGFQQCISHATRMHGSTATLIDHILTNSNAQQIRAGTIISDISDHFITFIVTDGKPNKKKTKLGYSRNLSTRNVERFRDLLSNTDWTSVFLNQDVNDSYELFWTKFKLLYDNCFPVTQVRFNKNIHKIHPFMTPGLLASRKTKNALHKQALANPTQANIDEYKSYKQAYNKTVRASKKLYYENSFAKASKDPKQTWKLINETLNRDPSQKNKIEKIKLENGSTTTCKKEISHEFNKFFKSAGKNIANAVNTTCHSPDQYLPPPFEHEMNFGIISQLEVYNAIKSLDPKSSLDIMGVSSKLLKCIAAEISRPLTHIYNLSLNTGVFPDCLKTSRIVPIYKGGGTDSCDNYRPISLLSSISKVLEKIVAKKITDHLEINDLLYNKQFGFRKGKNTEQNLISITNYISQSLNNGEFCVGVFLDLKKAFDVCSHSILLKKLDNLGIRGTTLNWFSSYLNARKQVVDIEGNLSDTVTLDDLSVIQGSTLGPILFNIYINDLPRSTRLHTTLFADDGSALGKGKKLPELIDYVNEEIVKIATWFRANKMVVNTKKTQYIIFRTKGKKIDTQDKEIVFNDNDPEAPQNPHLIAKLDPVHNNHTNKELRSYKLLGIFLDEYLSFDTHVQAMLNKLSRSVYMMNKIKNIVPQKALKSMYYALVHSHLNYCPIIVSSTTQTNITKICKMQKKAIRIVAKTHYTAHTEQLFAQLKIMKYVDIIMQAKLHFMHSIYYNYASEAFSEIWLLNANRDLNVELRNSNDYLIPRCNYEIIKRTPYHSLPLAWNNAPPAKYHSNLATFKIALKSSIFLAYTDSLPTAPYAQHAPSPPPPQPPPPPPPLPPTPPPPFSTPPTTP